MSKGRRTPKSPQGGGLSPVNQRDRETTRLANELLVTKNVVDLRKLAAIRGLVSNSLRCRAWPLLLGVDAQPYDPAEYAVRHGAAHKDDHVVDCDMSRSLWHLTEGWDEAARETKRDELRRVVNAAVNGNAGDIFYYQGLHDVAAVLLFVCGEATAYRMLTRLVSCHLRDCTRPTLEAAVEMLGLLYPILRAADPELHAYIVALHEPALQVPYFALSWYMTWFSHDVASLEQCARLFDLFLSSHPLMALYVAAVAMRAARDQILGCGPGSGDVVYSTLKKLTFLQPGQLSADELAAQAVQLYHDAPPSALVRKSASPLRHSSTLDAHLEAGRWQVPDQPQPGRAVVVAAKRLQAIVVPTRRRMVPLAALATVVMTGAGAAVLGAALLMTQADIMRLRHPYI